MYHREGRTLTNPLTIQERRNEFAGTIRVCSIREETVVRSSFATLLAVIFLIFVVRNAT